MLSDILPFRANPTSSYMPPAPLSMFHAKAEKYFLSAWYLLTAASDIRHLLDCRQSVMQCADGVNQGGAPLPAELETWQHEVQAIVQQTPTTPAV